MFNRLEQLFIEKQKEKDLMLKEIQELEQKLLELKNNNYKLYGEIESLVHVIEILK